MGSIPVNLPPTALELGLMRGSPPRRDQLVTLQNWQEHPFNRWSFQHAGQLMPTAHISRGQGPVAELPRAPLNLDGLDFTTIEGGDVTLADWLQRTCTDGFIVLHRGQIVAEEYFNGMEPDTLHILKSVSKSLTGALAGALVGAGLLEPLNLLSEYIPELAGTSLEGASVRHALDMLTGTKFSEDYDDPASDIVLFERAIDWRPVADEASQQDLFDYVLTLENQTEHGAAFEYRSIVTDVLALALERASGMRYAEAMSRFVWSRLGAEHSAEVTVDRHGNAIADGGISATLRDLARFGQMYLQGGCYNGRQIVPAAWINDTRWGDGICRGAFGPCESPPYPRGHYRNQWWVPDPDAGLLLASGIYGQSVFVSMVASVVIAKLSSLPRAADINTMTNDLRQFGAISAALYPLA